eukprot:g13754.t1
MEELVRLKSRFVSAKSGEGSSGHTGPDEAAARLVDGILRRKSFYFQQRSGKLDMRAIGRVDIDSVVKDVDIDTLQAHLENITFAHVSEDDLRLYSDQCFLNLFRLSQLLLEYLLSVQDTLATSLEALALKHSTVQKALDRGRAELHAASEQDRALKREVRQKRATIARYEQLLALPAPSSRRRDAPASSEDGGNLHSCLTCGKMFTTADFLQQHIVRKHATQVTNTTCSKSNANNGEEKTAYPPQLRLFVQTSTGQCLDMMVQGGATIAQLRGYINSTAGFEAAGPSKRLLYKGMLLHDEQTLREYNIPSDSQVVLLHAEPTEVVAREDQLNGGETKNNTAAAEESATAAATKQMVTLVELMRQQMEWSVRSESGRRAQDIGSTEALETRMRGIEASLPRRLEELMEESVGGLKSSLRKALDDMEEMHAKRSNAGTIQDDEEETRRKEEQEEARLAAMSADMARVCKENAALAEELARLKASRAVVNTALPARTESAPERPKGGDIIAKKLSHQQVVNQTPDKLNPLLRNTASSWTLTFPAEGSRRAVAVEVSRTTTCEALCGLVAAELDVADARVVLRDRREGAMIPTTMPSSEMQGLHEAGFLTLEVLQGHVLSDHAVDGLVDFYEQHVPVKARASAAVSQSLAEIDLAAKRHAVARRKGQGAGGGGLLGEGRGDAEDVTDHAEKQVENIRAQLSATLTGGRFPANDTDLSKSVSISQTLPGLGLVATGGPSNRGGNGIGDDDMFGDADEGKPCLSRADLERAVLERKRTRPAGIERQMENVSKTMEEQLNLLLEEAEDELQQLEQDTDSLGSATYSSTDPSDHAGVSALTESPGQHIPATGWPPLQAQADYDRADETSTQRHPDKSKSRARRGSRSVKAKHHGGEKEKAGGDQVGDAEEPTDRNRERRRLEDEDIPKSDWGRTLDTTVSIPEGPEERADEHEANASLEDALGRGIATDDSGGATVLVASKGGVDMSAVNAAADSTNS